MKTYNKPDVELVYFNADIVTASNLVNDHDADDVDWMI